jgi:hypothetical protein
MVSLRIPFMAKNFRPSGDSPLASAATMCGWLSSERMRASRKKLF